MCKSCIPKIEIDPNKIDAFAGQMLGIINHGALSTMISVGHRTKLFDVMDKMSYATSDEIAKAAGLKERYVREWLGAMVSGQIIEFKPVDNTYFLPPEHASFLTRRSNENNMAVINSMLAVWSNVEDKIVKCFEEGGGVSYSEYGRFHEVMGQISFANLGNNLIQNVLPYQKKLMNQLENGISVLDIGCGDGQVLMTLAQKFPKSTFYGIDICKDPIDSANQKADLLNLNNIHFKHEDLLEYNPNTSYDLITAFDVIHDLAFPDKVLKLVKSWLNDNGRFLMMDIKASSHLDKNINHPFAPFLYTASTMHCMTVSLSQGGLGLGTVWGEEKAKEMLKEAGLKLQEIKNYEHDMMNNYYFSTK